MIGGSGEEENVEVVKETIPTAVEQEYWMHALAAFDVQDYEVAAMHFRKLGARSRPLYNVAICYLLMKDEESAVVTFERALRCDPYFCLAHFQLAYHYYQVGDHSKAILYYNDSIQSMRGNGTIDYGQLGLEESVYACELFYNMAASQLELGDRGAALRSLVNAHQYRCLVRHDIVDHAMISATDLKWIIFEPPLQVVFRVKNGRRTLSLGSLRMFRPPQETPPNGRNLISVAEGEQDKTIQFMAPVHNEIDKVHQQRLGHARKHSRSSSMALSTTVSSLPPNNEGSTHNNNGPFTLAKVYFISKDDIVDQIRMICVDDCESFASLVEKIREKFGESRVKLKYRDMEGDLITMCEEADLVAAFHLSAGQASTSNVKLCLWCYKV